LKRFKIYFPKGGEKLEKSSKKDYVNGRAEKTFGEGGRVV